MSAGPNKHYVVFHRPRESHWVLYLVPAPCPLAAIESYLQWEDSKIRIGSDHSISMPWERRTIDYPHPVAAVEGLYKRDGEWQIRQLPGGLWDNEEPSEIFCGEQPWDIEGHIRVCRPYLRAEMPRSRAPGFVWYLRLGALVTFYRRAGDFQIEVLRRFLLDWSGPNERISRWDGDYQDILDGLSLNPLLEMLG
jgi:hypothetical protein